MNYIQKKYWLSHLNLLRVIVSLSLFYFEIIPIWPTLINVSELEN